MQGADIRPDSTAHPRDRTNELIAQTEGCILTESVLGDGTLHASVESFAAAVLSIFSEATFNSDLQIYDLPSLKLQSLISK